MAKHTEKAETAPAAGLTAPAAGPADPAGQRRGFLTKLGAIVAGTAVAVVPAAAGLWAFCDPIRRKKGKDEGGFVRVATLDSLSGDAPQFFQVIADKTDAWNFYPKEPLGGVYLRQTAPREVECLNATCPHAGCNVDLATIDGKLGFKCPCHNSGFEADGTRIDPEHCPSPRDLDALEVDQDKLKETGEIFVRYQRFRAGTAEQVADE